MSKKKFKFLLSSNATPLERALEAATTQISDVPVPLHALHNPGAIDLDLLPWLAWHLLVDSWKSYWTDEVSAPACATP